MIFLVVSCPCALIISVPLGFFGGIGAASKKGILIKGSNYLENLSKVGLVVFDKTGTLTKGQFKVSEIVSEQYSKEQLLEYAAYCDAIANSGLTDVKGNAYDKDSFFMYLDDDDNANFTLQTDVNDGNTNGTSYAYVANGNYDRTHTYNGCKI